MKTKFVDTNPYTYSTLCEKYKRFSMPHNQRPYAWKSQHINELWNAILENDEGYFIGNIVGLSPSEESEDSLIVIDGQQRLTTISLILIAFKKILQLNQESKINNELISLLNEYLFWRNPRTQRSIPRLSPGKDNLKRIFSDFIQGEISIDEYDPNDLDANQKRYYSNLKYIQGLIKKEIKGKKDNDVDVLVRKILSVQFISIVVETDNDIYDLFEGLNSTGLGLSIADLLKNAVLKSVPSNKLLRNDIESDWSQMEALFEGTNISWFPKFLRHYWVSKNGLISASKLFKEIKKEKIEKHAADDVSQFTKELYENAQIYIGLRDEKYESNLGLIKKDDKLKLLFKMFRYVGGLEQVYEVLLAVYNKRQIDDQYKPSVFKTDVLRLLNFAILSRFVSVNPSDYENIFALICEMTNKYSGVEYEKKTGPKFKELFKLVDREDEFCEKFSENLKYGSDSQLIIYIISELMKDYNEDDRGILIADPNIEHILPQKPQKWGYSEEEVSGFVNKIGNLTILHSEDNNDAGNDTFREKVEKVYLKSKFAFNRDISKYENAFIDEPEDAIKKRGFELGARSFKLLKVL